MTSPPQHREDITAVILAGGKARRMGGEDKGLIELHGRPLLGYVLDALRQQVANILVNANRNPERYRALGCPVAGDIVGGFHGPLAGIATGMQTARPPLLLVVPCDSPFLPGRLVEVLYRRMEQATPDICAAHDGSRLQQLDRAYLAARTKLSDGRGNLVGRAEQLKALGARASKRLPGDWLERAGAEAVGEAATSAVVTAILLITIMASLMTILFYRLGI